MGGSQKRVESSKMNRPVFASSSAGPMALATLRLMEHASLRPKTAAALPILALGGIGAFGVIKMLPPKDNKDKSRKNRQLLLWDFFDPQGHHQIQWNN